MGNRIVIAVLLICISLGAKGQYYETGQEPASFKWEKLRSYHFTFIYPEDYTNRIEKYVYSFEKAYELLKGSYKGPLLDNIPVIIHNHTTGSNGYVAWAPKRIELYPYPGQENIPMEHIQQLALHETMHVLQMNSFRRGISKTITYLFGEQYTGALGIFTPFWFLEGEAVYAETAWSYSGRGRIPSFEKKLKASLLENDKMYGYDKMIFGSYRDFTPNHYEFGYQMSAWARTMYGDKVWQEPMDYVALRPYTLNPLNAALKKYTLNTKEDVYYETMVYLRDRWEKEEKTGDHNAYRILNADKNNEYISYYSPVPAGRDSIIAVKTSLSDIPQFVLINTKDGTEKRLHKPGNIWPYKISYSGNTLVWAENYRDPRWANREYSVIKTMNIETGNIRRLIVKSRLFGPDISPDAKLIVAAESTSDFVNSLVIIDASSGNILNRYKSPDNKLISYPVWSDDMSEVIFISTGTKGEGVMSLNPETGQYRSYINEGWDDIQSVRKYGSSVYFVSSGSGTDNIFRMGENGIISRLTSSRFGVMDVSVYPDTILFSDYSAGGNNICVTGIQDIPGKEIKQGTSFTGLIDSLDRDEKLVFPDGYTLPSGNSRKKYNKYTGLFRFHSWMPFYADINNISFDNLHVSPGATIMTQNNLSTLISTAGYEYSNREHLLHTNISWRGWYPAVDFNLSYGGDPVIYNNNDTSAVPAEIYRRMSANTTFYIPLYFNRSRYVQTLWPSLSIKYSNRYILDDDREMFDYGQTLINARLYFSSLQKMSQRDIWPRFGQIIDFYFTTSLSDRDLYGPVGTFKTAVYLPGFFMNHGIRLRYQYEKQEFRRFLIHNRVSLPRGYKHIISENINSFSIDYAFPVAYPDFHLGQFLYLNRLRNTLFYDYAISNNLYDIEANEQVNGLDFLSSAGIEFLADFYILRIPVRLSAGLQAAYMPFKKSFDFELLFSMDVFGYALTGRNP